MEKAKAFFGWAVDRLREPSTWAGAAAVAAALGQPVASGVCAAVAGALKEGRANAG